MDNWAGGLCFVVNVCMADVLHALPVFQCPNKTALKYQQAANPEACNHSGMVVACIL